MAGLTTLFLRHLQDRKEAEEYLRRRQEAEQDRAEYKAEREYLKKEAKRPKPMSPMEFERALRDGLTTPKTSPGLFPNKQK